MIKFLISNEWKKFVRGKNSGASIFAQVFLAFMVLYLLFTSILLGIMLKQILHSIAPSQEINIYCIILFYYFLLDLPIRYWIQELPTLSLKPYLLQNVKKFLLIRFLNIRSLINFFNLIPLVIFLPFLFESIQPQYGNKVFIGFLVSILFTMLANHFLAMYLKRKSVINSKWLFGIVLIIILLAVGSSFNIFSLTGISKFVFSQLFHSYWLSILPIILFSLAFYFNWNLLKSNFYLDIDVKKKKNIISLDWADNFGELISNEIKLILRNKRSKNTFFISLIFLLYGLLFYKLGVFENKNIFMMLPLVGYMITSFSSLNYIQFLFSWQTAQFDQLMTAKHGIKTYIKSKLNLLRILNTLSFTLSLLYAFIDWRIIPLHICLYLFNMGLIIPLGTMVNLYNSKGLDLSQGTSMNYQGVGISSFISTLLPIGILYIIHSSISYFWGFWSGIIIIGLIGIISLFFQNWYINKLTDLLTKRKYQIISGFRAIK